MEKAKKILLYFLGKKTLNRTQVMKYLYYYEYLYRKHTQSQGTELNFVRYDYGPFDQSVYNTLETLVEEGRVNHGQYVNAYGKLANEYSTKEEITDLAQDEQDVADFVIYQLSRKSFQGMLDLVYSTPPMLKVLTMEEEQERKLLGEVLPMSETDGVFKRTKAGREAAFKRLAEREQTKGSDEEYREVILTEFQYHSQLRRRAQLVTQGPNSR